VRVFKAGSATKQFPNDQVIGLCIGQNHLVTVEREEDLVGLQRVGRLVRLTLDVMTGSLEPGMTTLELDRVGESFAERHGARSGPRLFYAFPGFSCISVNDEAVHGVPCGRVLNVSDLVKIDVTLELHGLLADACTTVCIPPVSDPATRIANAARAALTKGVARARAGKPISGIGRAVEAEVRRHGARVIRELGGHGIGRHIHEEPTVRNYFVPSNTYRLPLGLVFTIEPIIAETSAGMLLADDGWTLKTRDGSLAAQFEHTVVVTRGRALVLTA
jgi:methionyl aminopeptidase